MMKKSVLMMFLSFIMVSGLALAGTVFFATVYASTEVPSIISSDTTWTKANSPYELRGPVLVKNGATLTIEPGTTVTLSGQYIEVNGTLSAVGTSKDKIFFNSGTINFPKHCVSWDEETGSGCIIENSELVGSKIAISGSPKISNSNIPQIDTGSGSPVISGNTITGNFGIGGTPTIVNNSITGSEPGMVTITGSPTFLNNTINCRIVVSTGSPKFLNNAILDGIHADSQGGYLTIVGNEISYRSFGAIFVVNSGATITNNHIYGGIELRGARSFHISDNILGSVWASNPGPLVIERNVMSGIRVTISSSIFSPFTNDTLLIQNNFIKSSGTGIEFNHPSAVILNNTITSNHIGIKLSDTTLGYFSPVIRYNNINSSGYKLRTELSYDIDVAYNWWGTTDTQAINQSIYDLKYDFNLGTVNFTPFLTEENPNAEPKYTTPIPEFPAWALLPVAVVIILVAIFFKKNLVKKKLLKVS